MEPEETSLFCCEVYRNWSTQQTAGISICDFHIRYVVVGAVFH